MLTTAIVAFREFLEAFLLIGIFLGMDNKLHLRKKKEILGAAGVGILFSLLLPTIVFFFAKDLSFLLKEKNADMIEGYFLTFAGFFLAYVVFSLHAFMKEGKKKTIGMVKEKLGMEIFDVSLFLTLSFFIVREGFEIALLTASTALFAVFWSNMTGLFVGFVLAGTVGLAATIIYEQFPIHHIFRYTEYLIILIGAAMVKNGLSLLAANYFHLQLNGFLAFSLPFIPTDSTVWGHALYNLAGVQNHMGVVQLLLMGLYALFVLTILKAKQVDIVKKEITESN